MTPRAGLFYYLFSTLTCAVDVFHLFTDYVDLCFSRCNRKCVYFAPISKCIAIPKILIISCSRVTLILTCIIRMYYKMLSALVKFSVIIKYSRRIRCIINVKNMTVTMTIFVFLDDIKILNPL